MKYTRITLLLFLLLLVRVPAQTVSLPLTHPAYDALERWEVQGFISGVFNGTRPFSRQEMADHISKVWQYYKKSPEKFSRTDLTELYYLTLEFREELEHLKNFEPSQSYQQWRPRLYYLMRMKPFKYLNPYLYTNNRNLVTIIHKEFKFYADPILSYSIQEKADQEQGKYQFTRISNGFLFYGFLGPYFGFYFNLTDNHATDERYRGNRLPFEVWQESGWPYLTSRNNGDFDFDENIATVNFTYKYFTLIYGREYNQWGVGHHGNPLLSTNAPVYDQLKFIIRYWRFKFTHLTAFLQYISPEGRISMKSQPAIDQYWSGNRLELYLGKGVQLGLSEGVVYGNRSLQPGYLNPLSFYKSVEHYYGDRDNGVLGVDVAWRIFNGMKVYGEWFIDDITTTKLGSKWYGNKFAYQLGTFLVNPLFLKDCDILAEYIRIKPYVYSHSVTDYNKYKHYDTILGHFIGPNSDDLYLRFRKRFSKFLMVGLEYETYRHGSNPEDRNVGGDPDRPWQEGDSREVTFLDGIQHSQQVYGFLLHYEFIRNLFAEFHYNRFKFRNSGWENLLAFRISFNFGYRQEPLRNIFPVDY
jgi:hypothetical protein